MNQIKCIALGLIIISLILSSCGVLKQMYDPFGLFDDGNDEGTPGVTSDPAIESSHKYAIALGGVAEGRDELILMDDNKNIRNFNGKTLEFFAEEDVVGLLPRPGFDSFAEGAGAEIVPQRVGITTITYSIDGAAQEEKFEVTVPPQSLIQVLMGEAREEFSKEATLNESGAVALSSDSKTGDAIGAVIRNRVLLLEGGLGLDAFEVDESKWSEGEEASHWDAVIEAGSGPVYQFSPVDPTDLNNSVYKNAEARSYLDSSEHRAYDQAVLTAAGIFNQSTLDITNGAFAFRSPTSDESRLLAQALFIRSVILPPGCGVEDDNFPLFAPVQVLIHPDVAGENENEIVVPSFVFIRSRSWSDPAVTDTP